MFYTAAPCDGMIAEPENGAVRLTPVKPSGILGSAREDTKATLWATTLGR